MSQRSLSSIIFKSGLFNPVTTQTARFSFTNLARDSTTTTTTTETPAKTDGEQKLINLLKSRFSQAQMIDVTDISGGCGSMYAVYVETEEFTKVRRVKQHQMVNEVLRSEITNNMHGIRIQTAAPGQETK